MHANEIVENLITKLDAVKQVGGGYMGRCPAHEDSKPSLAFRAAESGDTVLIHCHAGCTIQAIAAALQIDIAMLLHGEPATAKKKEKKKEYAVLPPGEYLARLISVNEKRANDGASQWGAKFMVASGEYRGEAWIFDTWRFDADGLQHFKHACSALGIDTSRDDADIQPPMLEGRTCTLKVEQFDHDGLKRHRIVRPGGYSLATEKTYDYQDAKGNLLFQVVRLEPKAFYQRRPNGHGGWVYSLDGITRVLYLLPTLLAAPADQPIFVVEGEKDADRLTACGFLATTNPQGGSPGMWGKVDEQVVAQVFTKRRAFILTDNDKTGAGHSREVAASIERIASDIRVIEFTNLPAKADVSDWFAASPDNTPAALLALCEAATPWLPGSEGHVITNFATDEVEDSNGKKKKVQTRIDLAKIVRAILFACDGWPKRLGQQLFIDHSGEISMLSNEHAVFSFLHSRAEIKWMIGCDAEDRNYVTRGELVSTLEREAALVDDIAELPMEPEPPRVYFTRQIPKSGNTDGSIFERFLSFFSVNSEIDQALLCGLALTPFWGGPPGKRPLFVITGPDGIGEQQIGKTSTAVHSTSIHGDDKYFALKLGPTQDAPAKQLVSEGALRARVVLIDNLSGITDSADLAELITLPSFSGRPAYGRQRSRVNYLTWVATAVSPQFSRDLSSRSYVIQLAPPAQDKRAEWDEEITAFVAENRDRLILDAISLLRGEKEALQRPLSRFPLWDKQVLACHYAAQEAIRTKIEREQSIDSEDEALALFLRQLKVRGRADHKIEEQLEASQLAEVWNKATGHKYSAVHVPRKLREYMAKGKLPEAVRPKWIKKHGSPWLITYSAIKEIGPDDQNRAENANEQRGEQHGSPGEDSF